MNDVRTALRVITPPGTEPVTRGEAKNHLRVDHTDDDALIDALIAAARDRVETITGRALCRQSLRLYLDCFPCEIVLPRPPLLEVQRIQYIDAAGAVQTLGSGTYRVSQGAEPAMIEREYGATWPTTRSVREAVWVDYWAGYAPYEGVSPTDDAFHVPAALKQAVLLTVGHLYENREEVVLGTNMRVELPQGARALAMQHAVIDFRLSH